MKNRITATPLIGIDNIRFGMPREEVREILGEVKEFIKSEFDENSTDDFGFCHVYYNFENKCEAIELFDEVDVYIDETKIFPISIDVALDTFESLEDDPDGPISYKKSIGIYAPDGEMESILFGVEGYYDE